MKVFYRILLIAVCLSVVFPCTPYAEDKTDPAVLRTALLPDEDASVIIKRNEPLKKYLEKRLNKKIKIIVTTDYSSMIEAMRFGRLELAYFGGFSYILAKSKSDIEPFVCLKKKGKLTYRCVIITHPKSGVSTLKDIAGKNMAYGDPASTSSHLMPNATLFEAGLEAGKDYKAHYLGTHDAVALAVQNGHVEAGGLNEMIFKFLVERGIISLDKVKIVAFSKPYPNYPWTMRSDLKPELKAQIKAAFLELKDPKITKLFKAEGFGAVTDADYDILRKTAKMLKLVK